MPRKQTVSFRVGLDEFGITPARIRGAMREFDKGFRGKESETGTGFAVIRRNKLYPPKRLLALAIGRPTHGFSGGDQANGILRRLGFDVRRLNDPRVQQLIPGAGELNLPVPQPEAVVRKLFSQKWKRLDPQGRALRDRNLRYPGVYVLANDRDMLDGKYVDESRVFYVGMSNHASLATRLKQFLDSANGGKGHSAGERFFQEYCHGSPYRKNGRNITLWWACVPIPCLTNKRARTATDLKKIGAIAAAEQYALARVKDKTKPKREPSLNKQ